MKKPFLKKDFLFGSILHRLILVVVIVLLIFCSLSVAITINNAKKNLIDSLQDQQNAFSEYISRGIDIEINKTIRFFTDLAKELSDKPIEEVDLITGRHIPPIFNHGVVLISPDGRRIVNELPIIPGRKELSFAQSEWFQRARLADQVIISKPLRNRITQEPSIVFTAPIKNNLNKVIAVVAGIIELNHPELFRSLYSSQIGKSGGFLVVSPKDKMFVASTLPEMVLKPTPEPGKNRLHDMAMNGYRGIGVTTNANGVEEIAAISSVKSTGWFVVVRIPLEEAYRPVYELSKTLVIHSILLIITVIFIIAGALLLMLSPLKKSAKLVELMASGKQPLEKLPVTYKDEVGNLISGFNTLVDKVDERTTNLEDTKSELERHIEEINQLSGMLPICASCKKIRDDEGYWTQIETYITTRSEAKFSHGICEECTIKRYGDQEWFKDKNKKS